MVASLLHQLHNGLSLIMVPSQLAPVVAIQAWVSVGSADETPRQAGLTHMLEHMLFKGTERRGVGQVARDVESAGGEINAWTSRDNTVFHVVMPSRYADTGIDVLADALGNPLFDPLETEREREVILEEIRQGQDQPLRVLAKRMFATAFESHPYGKPVIGTVDTVSSFGAKQLRDFHHKWYRASNLHVVVAGDFEPGPMKALVDKHFGELEAGSRPRRRRKKEAMQCERRATLEGAALSQARLAMAFHAPQMETREIAALDLMAVVLGQGESSELSQVLVRDRELCRSAYSYVHSLRDHSLAVIGASCDSEHLVDAVDEIGYQIGRFGNELVAPEALEKAQHAIEADSIYQKESVEATARSVGANYALTGRPDFESEYIATIRSIDAHELRDAARRYLDPTRVNLSAMVPTELLPRSSRSRQARARLLGSALQKGATRAHKAAKAGGPKSQRKAKAKSGKSAELVQETLDNGIKVLVLRDAEVPVVAARAVWDGGLLLEKPGNNGIHELMAELMTRGCGRLSAAEIIEEVDSTAATLAGFAGRNSFGLQAEWLAKDWQRGFELFTECLLAPRFDPEEVARSKRRQLRRIAAQKDSASALVFRLFQETLYKKHPYRRDHLGRAESLRRLDQATLLRFLKRNYPLANLTLAIVGDVDPQRMLDKVKARFEKIPSSPRSLPQRSEERFEGRRESSRQVFGYLDREQAQLVVGFPGLEIDDSDRFALEVLMTVLGGQGGRLFVELRDRQSLAYQIGAYSLEGLDPGYVAIYLSCAPDKVDTAVAAIRSELDKVLASGVTAEELKRSKRYLIGTHEISLQRRSSIASAIAFHVAYGLDHDAYLSYAGDIQRVTAADIERVARRILRWDLAVTATVLPLQTSPEAERRMTPKSKKRPRSRKPSRKSGKAKRGAN